MKLYFSQILELKKLWKNKRQLLFQSLNLAMIVFSALMIWKGLMFLTKSESPVVVVLRYLMTALLSIIFHIFMFSVDQWNQHFKEGIYYF